MSSTEKLMVMNVYKQTYKKWPHGEVWSLAACVQKTAELVGISTITVNRIVKEHKSSGTFSSPKKAGPKINFLQKMDKLSYMHTYTNSISYPTYLSTFECQSLITEICT